jgi:hypothetical protein
MPSIMQSKTRRNALLAITAALIGASASLPAPAAAGSQRQPGCDPSYQTCEIYYTYYTDYHRTVVTGHGNKDCDGNVTVLDGYATSWWYYEAFPCPF